MIEVTNIENHEDGSATVSLKMTEEALALLVRVSLVQALEKMMAEDNETT